MPRFFDDYSNTYLTHDSAAGRKQQRRGWKFRENFKVGEGKGIKKRFYQ
jgi:U1 small nuclear ribonucleoprotein C